MSIYALTNTPSYGTIVPFLILESVGWGGRCGDTRDSYIMQIATLIIGPTFLSAMIYVDLGVIGLQYGPKFSILGPRVFAAVFITADVVSILVQAAGKQGYIHKQLLFLLTREQVEVLRLQLAKASTGSFL